MNLLPSIVSITMRMATPDDSHLPAYDHTRLSNVNTCPTWGALRYGLHKVMPGAGRAMALEAGAAAHEGFAACRWHSFYTHQVVDETTKRIALAQGVRIFGEDRFTEMMEMLDEGATERTNRVNFSLQALYSSGFYDDPTDKKRTVSSISDSLVTYIDAYDPHRYPIWVRDPSDPNSDIGIEIAYDIVVTIEYTFDGEQVFTLTRRFTGKLDGLHVDREDLTVMEDKTGSRLDDAWLAQWELSHQITGYNLAASTFIGQDVHRAVVTGMKIPIASNVVDTIRQERVHRHAIMYTKWAEWFVHSVLLFEEAEKDILSAPMYTHSCNRYFSACSFLPLCTCLTAEEKQTVINEMEHEEWSPLDE